MRTLLNRVMWVALAALCTFVFVPFASAEEISVVIAANHFYIEGEPVIVDDFSGRRHVNPVLIDKLASAVPKDGGSIVDVLFFYTTALAEVQSLETIEQRAEEALVYLNQALSNSSVTHRIAHCGVQKIEYIETGDLLVDINEIQHPANEHLDTLGCDVGVAFIDAPQHPGLGGTAMAAVTTDPERSTSVLWPQAPANAMAHEFGHNSLCLHNVEEYGQVHNYNGIGRHGHWDFDPLTMDDAGNGGAFATIMSYQSQEVIDAELQALTIPHFSNPEKLHHGIPTGVEHISECALLLEHRMVFMAEYREKNLPCVASNMNLCLAGERFKVEVAWRDFNGNTGSGRVVPGAADNSGLFWFFGPSNWEVLVKVLDACGLNDRFWVFSAATTNVEYTMTVTDSQTGDIKTYFNPLGQPAPATTDTDAFTTCN
jgi:hypothetical protein